MFKVFSKILDIEILRNFRKFFFNNALRQFLSFGISIVIARLFGPEGRGEYALFNTLIPLFSLFLSLGLNNALLFKVKSNLISLKQACLILIGHSSLSLIFLVLAYFLVQCFLQLDFLAMYSISNEIIFLSLSYYFIISINLLLTSYFLAIGDSKNHLFLVTMIPGITLLLIIIGAIIWSGDRFHPIMALVSAETFAAAIFLKRLLNKSGSNWSSFDEIRSIYSYALKSYLSGLNGTIVAKVDNVVVAGFIGLNELGIYAIAKSFYQLILSIPQAFSGYIFGLFVEKTREDGLKILFNTSCVVAILTSFAAVPLLVFPTQFVKFFFGTQFVGASIVIQLLVLAAIIVSTSSPILRFMLANDRPGLASISTVLGGMVTVTSLMVLVPNYSILGASYASFCGACATFILRISMLSYLRKM